MKRSPSLLRAPALPLLLPALIALAAATAGPASAQDKDAVAPAPDQVAPGAQTQPPPAAQPPADRTLPAASTPVSSKDPEASLRVAIMGMPEGRAKATIVRSLDQAADKKTSEEKAEVIRVAGGEIAESVVGSEEWGGVKPEVRNQVSNAVAGALNDAGDYEHSRAVSNDVLQRAPDNRDALNNVAISHYYLHDFAAAIADATRAMKTAPDDSTAYTTRAMSHLASGDYLQAIEDARHALAIDKNNQTAFSTLRLAESHVGPSRLDLTPAQRAQADAINREYQEKLDQQAEIESSAKEGRAGTVSDASAAPADPAEPFNRRAAELEVQKDFPAAIAAATRALAVNPRSAEAYFIRARAQTLIGRYDKAVEDASAALAIDPANAAALDARAQAYLRLDRAPEALQDCKRSVALKPDNSFAHANCAKVHQRLGNPAEAAEDYKDAAALNPVFQPDYVKALAALSQGRPSAPEPSIAQPPPPAPLGSAPSPWKRYLATVACTVLGGLLIATGILHIVTGGRRPAAPETSPKSHSGLRLDNFKILRAIGQGGMGVVYEAQDAALGRTVAVKKLRDEIKLDAAERERFLQEARTVAALHHPSIVEIHTILEHGDDLYLVFEYVSGRTVHEVLDQKKSFSLAEAKLVMRGACEALEYAHHRGVIHRDLKPSNIMLTNNGHVKVMDFGIARQAKDAVEKAGVTNTVVGTPQYMAPEAEQGIVRREMDVYALGACLYEMLTGRRPFPGSAMTPHKLAMDYPKPSRLRPGLGPELDALIDAALQPDPDKRIKTPVEFMARLEAVPEPALA